MTERQRKSLEQLRHEAIHGDGPVQIAGKPADVCPYCGCAMFANGTREGEAVTFRYVHCRNKQCGKRFYSKQPPAVLVREIGDDDIPSSSGQPSLTVLRESA